MTIALSILMHVASEQVSKHLIKSHIVDCLGSPIGNAMSLLTLALRHPGASASFSSPGSLYLCWRLLDISCFFVSSRGREKGHFCCSCLVSVWSLFLSPEGRPAPSWAAVKGGAVWFTCLWNGSAHSERRDSAPVLTIQLSQHQLTANLVSPLSSLLVPSRTPCLTDGYFIHNPTAHISPWPSFHQIVTIQKSSSRITFKLSGKSKSISHLLTDESWKRFINF